MRKYTRKRLKEHPEAASYKPAPRVKVNTCNRCQARLATKFEDPASDILKAMMEGSDLILAPSQQLIVARWFFIKTSALFTIGRKYALRRKAKAIAPPAPEVTELQRQILLTMLGTLAPPENSTVRIAYIADDAPASTEPFVPHSRPRFANHAVNVIQRVVGESIIGGTGCVIPFIEATKNDERFVLFWPANASGVSWPPIVPIRAEHVIRLRDEWQHPPLDVIGQVVERRPVSPPPPAGESPPPPSRRSNGPK